MTIAVLCQCGKRFKAKDEQAGKTFSCPLCGASLSVPISDKARSEKRTSVSNSDTPHFDFDFANKTEATTAVATASMALSRQSVTAASKAKVQAKGTSKARYIIAAVGGLITLQGVIFKIIEPSLLATIAMVGGMVVIVAGLNVEIHATIRQALNNLSAYFVRVKEQRTRLAKERERESQERERESQLEIAAAKKKAAERVVESQIPAGNKTEQLKVLSSEPTHVPCPYCGKLIIATAIKCRYCNEFLDGRTIGTKYLHGQNNEPRRNSFRPIVVIGLATLIGIPIFVAMRDSLHLAQTGADGSAEKFDRTRKARLAAIMGVPDDVVSKDNYDRIRDGMSYSEVVGIIGSRGTELSSSRLEGIEGVMPSITTKMYSWQNPNATNMTAMFQNDRLVSKAQFGLR